MIQNMFKSLIEKDFFGKGARIWKTIAEGDKEIKMKIVDLMLKQFISQTSFNGYEELVDTLQELSDGQGRSMKKAATFTNQFQCWQKQSQKTCSDVSMPQHDKAFRMNLSLKNFREEKLDGKNSLFIAMMKTMILNFKDNWVVAYKNSILQILMNLMKLLSSAQSSKGRTLTIQDCLWTSLSNITKNTDVQEHWILYWISDVKNTLTRDYVNKHRMILIGYTHNAKVDTQVTFISTQKNQNWIKNKMNIMEHSQDWFDGFFGRKDGHTGEFQRWCGAFSFENSHQSKEITFIFYEEKIGTLYKESKRCLDI